MLNDLELTRQRIGNVELVKATGAANSISGEEIGVLGQLLVAEGSVNAILNLTGIEYLSSTGMREMVMWLKAAKRNGGNLVLVNKGNEKVTEVLELAGLITIFDIFETPELALAAFENIATAQPTEIQSNSIL